jgi:hypothetical protein
MTGELFLDYLKALDASFRAQGRSVLLVLDNCSAHVASEDVEFTHIKLFFLPPNVTSVLQPCDGGTVSCWSRLHRIRRIVSVTDMLVAVYALFLYVCRNHPHSEINLSTRPCEQAHRDDGE